TAMLPLRSLSRRAAVIRLGGGGLAAMFAGRRALAAAENATPVATPAASALPDAISAIIEGPKYGFARWGIHVADRGSGATIWDLHGDQRFLAASTTKLFPAAAALAAYGTNYRFETPIYRTGAVGADGALAGNLVLVASGDLTMGGRTTPDGQIAYTSFDHIYANVFPTLATLTPENPLAGLDDLARQVAAAGIRHVAGDVIVDARLFPEMKKDDYILTPIWINDNLIDISLTPGAVGDPAVVDWRPQTAAYRVQSDVRTVAPDETLSLAVTAPSPGVIAVAGQLPVTVPHALQTYQVMDPPAFARTLLIEALGRAGVTVAATATGPNPDAKLPPPGSYAAADRVALLTSPPFAQNIKLILKVSMNQHADMLIFLLALKHGEKSFDAGLAQIPPFLRGLGLDPETVSLSDGRGNEYTDLFSPQTVSHLLQAMTTQPDFPAYFAALPILGVDGSEIDTVGPTSPVRGKAFAKSGTTVAGDAMNQRPLTMVRALAGYLTAKSGRELIFATYVADVPLKDTLDVLTVIKDQGAIAEIIYADH
ncbi:MAG TPA: D-alanyl-D-alanine carboxypeptidase/D-alanyl-D-alanine-endopeptidase, partial [Thermomicrobiales bacterium]|nr:D-alanyl-D-alanine carboxypeptidase/D-alanyl-D-alanine-endopeptidase [Thermomicrobiales bacterium]